ncbi:MAG: RdgB/HAM1 family non-canonical purine NTP pyrophosphatase [Candidatus Caccosoma sp.]|nr:RdgB/HAM1 family non-canonical purine NTP pyrophosphatase [Candidatus Caccosoma sp.]
MDIVIATNNEHKVLEYKNILKGLNINCLSLNDLNIKCEPDETGKDFLDNSLIKAKEIARFTDKVIIADDSGLLIESLPNLLGVYSHRFLPLASYREKCEEILELLENSNNRKAKFVCVITLYNFKNEPIFFKGECLGSIGYEIKGDNGFGFDPIFIPKSYNKTMAELSEQTKNSISHRGIASKKLIAYLKESGVC